MWVDMDTVMQDMSFEIPLANYAGKDFVVWGHEDKITKGDVYNGKIPSISHMGTAFLIKIEGS